MRRSGIVGLVNSLESRAQCAALCDDAGKCDAVDKGTRQLQAGRRAFKR